jgi:sigma-B regulation protein RsbU (phosphoserine phosphatase)
MSFASLPLFAALPPDELARLTGTLREMALDAGALLFHEGDEGHSCFIVLDGEIGILRAMERGERLLAVQTAGQLFGEGSLLHPDHRRTAGARALTSARLLEITRQDFEALLARHPSFAYELLRQMSFQLRAANDATINDLQEKNRQLTRAYEELQAAQSQLIEKEKLEHELQMAREMQEQSLPRRMPNLPGFSFGARLAPARLVSGDFFDFIELDADRVGIVVGDVCGKGVPAAFFTAQTRSLLRGEAGRAVAPAAALREVNRHLLEMSAPGMFVTMVYGVLDRRTREFVFVRAGHELPLLSDGCGRAAYIGRGLGHPLGILPEPALEEHTSTLPPGATLLIYTDGVTEAMDARGSQFGATLLRATAGLPQPSPQALCDHLLDTIRAFHGDAPQDDDVTLVAVRGE